MQGVEKKEKHGCRRKEKKGRNTTTRLLVNGQGVLDDHGHPHGKWDFQVAITALGVTRKDVLAGGEEGGEKPQG